MVLALSLQLKDRIYLQAKPLINVVITNMAQILPKLWEPCKKTNKLRFECRPHHTHQYLAGDYCGHLDNSDFFPYINHHLALN